MMPGHRSCTITPRMVHDGVFSATGRVLLKEAYNSTNDKQRAHNNNEDRSSDALKFG